MILNTKSSCKFYTRPQSTFLLHLQISAGLLQKVYVVKASGKMWIYITFCIIVDSPGWVCTTSLQTPYEYNWIICIAPFIVKNHPKGVGTRKHYFENNFILLGRYVWFCDMKLSWKWLQCYGVEQLISMYLTYINMIMLKIRLKRIGLFCRWPGNSVQGKSSHTKHNNFIFCCGRKLSKMRFFYTF